MIVLEDKRVDFTDFSSRRYLNEYYSSCDEENKFLLESFHEIYKDIDDGLSIFEVGGGPTIYQLMSASNKAGRVLFSDFSKSNLMEVAKWFKCSPSRFDWNDFLNYVADIEGTTKEFIEWRMLDLDIEFKQLNVLGGIPTKADLVSSCFCIESITDNYVDYSQLFSNIKSAADKYIVMAALRNAEFYKVGKVKYSAFPVDMMEIIGFLDSDFKMVKSFSMDCDYSRGYDGIIVFLARRVS